jgi:hypothetical protein
MQPGQAAKSKAETIGRTPKFVAITTPICLPIIFAVPIEVNLPKESVSLLIFGCHIDNILHLTLVYPIRSSYTCVGHMIAIFAVAIGVLLYGRSSLFEELGTGKGSSPPEDQRQLQLAGCNQSRFAIFG